jgi:hypothetical protein
MGSISDPHGYIVDLSAAMYHLAELGIRILDVARPIQQTVSSAIEEEHIRVRYEGRATSVPDIIGRAVVDALNRHPDCPEAIRVAMSEFDAAAATVLDSLPNRPAGLLDSPNEARIDRLPCRWRSIIGTWRRDLATLRLADGSLDPYQYVRWLASESGLDALARWREIIDGAYRLELLADDLPQDAAPEGTQTGPATPYGSDRGTG